MRLAENRDILGLVADHERGRVIGVRVIRRDNGRDEGRQEEMLAGDLIVDATGRGSRTPDWLDLLGYSRPPTDRVEIHMGYSTRTYRLRAGAMGADRAIILPPTADSTSGGFVVATEGGRHLVTMAGVLAEYPPLDPEGFEAFAASLPFSDVAEAIRGGEALDDPVQFRFPANVRHRYYRLRRFPAGLLVIGDAVCSFNPVYGQGMTVAALEAVALRRLLRRGSPPDPQRWFHALAKLIDAPWQIAIGADLSTPQVVGRRTLKIRLVNAYLPRYQAAAAVDAVLGGALNRVLGMVNRPESLLRPDRVARVLLAHLTGNAGPSSSHAKHARGSGHAPNWEGYRPDQSLVRNERASDTQASR